MNSPAPISNRLLAYGSAACGAAAVLTGNSEAATIINVNASSYNTGLSNLGTISATGGYKGTANLHFSGTGVSLISGPGNDHFDRAVDIGTVTPRTGSSVNFQFLGEYGESVSGSARNSSDNWFYAFGATDSSQRMWIQLQFGGYGTSGFSVVKLVIPSFEGELPSASHAAAVPESSSLALLSLGAVGLLKRRRRAA